MIAYLGDKHPTTRRMMEGILAMEEEHADDLVSLLEDLAPGSRGEGASRSLPHRVCNRPLPGRSARGTLRIK